VASSTKIEWCDATFNPWTGCTKVSPGCANCYAESHFSTKMRGVKWGPQGDRVVASESKWAEPIKWDKLAKTGHCLGCAGRCIDDKGEPCEACSGTGELGRFRARVFCASMADVFEDWQGSMLNAKHEKLYLSRTGGWIDGGPSQFSSKFTMQHARNRLFATIDSTYYLDYLLLTKRIENVGRMIPDHWSVALPKNVWIGTSVENRDTLYRIDRLREIKARVRFLSVEPLLADLGAIDLTGIHWVIVGGESGPNARPMNSDWVRSLRDQCVAAGVPFFFKQWGQWIDAGHAEFGKLPDGKIIHINSAGTILNPAPTDENADCITLKYVDKKRAGRILDMKEWSQFPEV